MLADWLPGADDPATMLLALALALGGALRAERARRRRVLRLWRRPEGVVIETGGVFGRRHRLVPAEEAARARLHPLDPHGPARGLVALRLPSESRAYVLDPAGGSIPFGPAARRDG